MSVSCLSMDQAVSLARKLNDYLFDPARDSIVLRDQFGQDTVIRRRRAATDDRHHAGAEMVAAGSYITAPEAS